MTATNENLVTITREAGADLTGKQFYFVELNSSGQVIVADSAGANAIGILQREADAAGKAVVVAIGGISKLVAGGALATIGTELSSTNEGKAVATTTNYQIMGVQLTAAGAEDELVEILLRKNGISA